jgi:ankyrin repeat protein
MVGQNEIIKLLIKKGADPNAKDVDMQSPLHFASENGKTETVKYLIQEAKALPFEKNKVGQYPCNISLNLEVRNVFDEL